MATLPSPVDLGAYVAAVRRVLESSYAVQDQALAGRRVLVGRRRDFRLRWFASRLYTTVCVMELDGDVDAATLDGYLVAAGREARAGAGGTPGLQSGSAVIAIAAMPQLTETARAWAAQPPRQKFASIAYPVAVGVGSGQVVEPARLGAGRLFQAFLHDVTQQVAAAPLGG